jgi:predicted MFS family arabinose efflux permease
MNVVESSSGQTKVRERLIIIGCAVAYSVGGVSGWIGPQILYGVMQQYHVAAAQAGLLLLVEGGTAGVLSMVLGAYPPNVTHKRLAIVGMALYILMNLVSVRAPGFYPLLGIRFVSGIGDALLIFVAASIVAMTSKNPDGSFAAINVGASAYAAAIIAAPPVLLPSAQGLTYLAFAAAVALLVSPALLFLPADTRPGRLASDRPAVVRPDKRSRNIFFMLITSAFSISVQTFAMFTFSPVIGARLGMPEAAINTALGSATLTSIIGPFAAAWLARRFGRWRPMFIAVLLLCGANGLLAITRNPLIFRLSLVTDMTGAYFLMPLLLAWCADIDHSGRYSSIMMGVYFVVPAFTPTVVGYFLDRSGLEVLLSVVGVTGTVCIVTLLLLRTATRVQFAAVAPVADASLKG